jgi:hypothetical protein
MHISDSIYSELTEIVVLSVALLEQLFNYEFMLACATQALALHGSSVKAAAATSGAPRVINVRATVERSELATIAAQKAHGLKKVTEMVQAAVAKGQMAEGDIDERAMQQLKKVRTNDDTGLNRVIWCEYTVFASAFTRRAVAMLRCQVTAT